MRYLPLTDTDRTAMLATIGASSIDDLFIDVPEFARLCAGTAERDGQVAEMVAWWGRLKSAIGMRQASVVRRAG